MQANIVSASAVIDNGKFGTRTIRFETGRFARQAAGSVCAYLDEETMLLSATTAGKHPKDQLDSSHSRLTLKSACIPWAGFRAHSSAVKDAPAKMES